MLIDKKTAGEYLRTIFVEILPAVVGNRPPELPTVDVDLQDYVSRVAVRFFCQLGDKDSLRNVFSCLTSYHFLEKRIQNGRTEIYHLLQDCPHLLDSCLLNLSNAVRQNVVIPQVSAPWLEWNVSDLSSIECLSGFSVFATASDKKTVAAAKGRSLVFVDASSLKIVGGPFELSRDTIKEINGLEFSPDQKFVLFGRLDKWFSVERGLIEDLPQFSENSFIYEWGLFAPDGRCIVVKRSDSFHVLPTCQDKCCIV